MSDYRYVTTDIVTGKVLSDALPIIGQTCTRNINGSGSFSGTLMLSATASSQQLSDWVAAVQPWKSMLWVLQDSFPIWAGPVTSTPHNSISDGTLPIQAATVEEIFKWRQISTTLTYSNLDIFEIFRQELNYATTKTANARISGTGIYANASGIVDDVAYSGVIGSITEQASLKKIYDAWTDLINTYELEYALSPAMSDAGSLYFLVQLGLPTLGRPFSETGLQFVFPQRWFIDYAYQFVPQNPANTWVTTGAGGTDNSTSYTSTKSNTTELSNGYPLLEDSYAYTGTVTSQSQLDSYTALLVSNTDLSNQVTPLITLGANAPVLLRDISLGDECMFAATSPLHPPQGAGLTPGLTAKFRVIGWTLTPPSNAQSESIQLQLAGTSNVGAQ